MLSETVTFVFVHEASGSFFIDFIEIEDGCLRLLTKLITTAAELVLTPEIAFFFFSSSLLNCQHFFFPQNKRNICFSLGLHLTPFLFVYV